MIESAISVGGVREDYIFRKNHQNLSQASGVDFGLTILHEAVRCCCLVDSFFC